MHIEIEIDNEIRKEVQEYASKQKVKLSRAYAEILGLGLELYKAGKFENTSKWRENG